MNCAPASRAAFACAGVSTVPAPANKLGRLGGDASQRFRGARRAKRDLGARETAVDERARERNRVVGIVDRDHGNDAHGAQPLERLVAVGRAWWSCQSCRFREVGVERGNDAVRARSA